MSRSRDVWTSFTSKGKASVTTVLMGRYRLSVGEKRVEMIFLGFRPLGEAMEQKKVIHNSFYGNDLNDRS